MKQLKWLQQLSTPNNTKMVLIVMDGVGGLPNQQGQSALEAADSPNLDKLAAESITGLSTPVRIGITPGSGPAHVGLFGYDPLQWDIGRGVLAALGIGFDLQPTDLAARGNFATVDNDGNITDRRAGRIPTKECERLVKKLESIELPDAQPFIRVVKEYRFMLALRGDNLHSGLTDSDPQQTGVPPLPVKPTRPEAKHAAELLNLWMKKAREILADEPQANSLNLRGISQAPPIPLLTDTCQIKAGAIATYPMYRGIAKLVGMDVLETGTDIKAEVQTLKDNWGSYDYFFFHIKKTDSYGEDGNFEQKAAVIEKADQYLQQIRELRPDVLVVTGDHSTPCTLKSHSWHEVPVSLWSKHHRPDSVTSFTEKAMMQGGLGHLQHEQLLPLMMAHALRLKKFGA